MAANAVNTVDFSNNYVNASDLKGAFVSWELVPNGPSVVPANSERSPPLLNATTLNAYKNDGNYESFKPESSVSFQVGEEVRLEGRYIKTNDE